MTRWGRRRRRLAALACDYDGTIATEGRVAPPTLDSLRRLRQSGCKLILVTGRELEDLRRSFPDISAFDRVVVENGALVYNPSTGIMRRLADPPPATVVATLRSRGVDPLAVGDVVIATSERHRERVLEAIAELGLPLQLFANKGALMILPRGINKGVGLAAALSELGLSLDNCVGIGDAENDQELLSMCGWSVAVANAVATLKEQCDFVTESPCGNGVSELVDLLIGSDFNLMAVRRER